MVKSEPLDLERSQERKASILAWLNLMEGYLAVGNSLANVWYAMAKTCLESRVWPNSQEIITKLCFQSN